MTLNSDVIVNLPTEFPISTTENLGNWKLIWLSGDDHMQPIVPSLANPTASLEDARKEVFFFLEETRADPSVMEWYSTGIFSQFPPLKFFFRAQDS